VGQKIAGASKLLEVLAISSAYWLVDTGAKSWTSGIVGGHCISVYTCHQCKAAKGQSLAHHFEVVFLLSFLLFGFLQTNAFSL